MGGYPGILTHLVFEVSNYDHSLFISYLDGLGRQLFYRQVRNA